MHDKNRIVFQTISIFVVLAILTVIFVFTFDFIFFGVDLAPALPAMQ